MKFLTKKENSSTNQPSSLNRFRILIFFFLGEYAEFGCSDIMITPSRYMFFFSFSFLSSCFSCLLSVLVRMVRIMMGGGSGRIVFRVFFFSPFGYLIIPA